MNTEQKCNQIKEEFESITGKNIDFTIMKNGNEHKPTILEEGKSGVFVFFNEIKCFKVGKVGTNSRARWSSHHYNLDKTTPSSLPKSIKKHKEEFKKHCAKSLHNEIDNFENINIGLFIKNNLSRIEFILDFYDKLTLNLLEALTQFHFQPIFEGRVKKSTEIEQ